MVEFNFNQTANSPVGPGGTFVQSEGAAERAQMREFAVAALKAYVDAEVAAGTDVKIVQTLLAQALMESTAP